MRKAKYLSIATAATAVAAAAVMAAMTVIVSCSAAEGSIDSGSDDGTKGLYTIVVMKTENGSIKASRSAANANQTVTVTAVPAEASKPETSGGGGGEYNDPGSEDLSHWYLTNLSISYDGGKAVSRTKVATNQWTFTMPAGNVVIDGTFSQTPVKSAYLEILSVSVNSTITPELEYKVDNYTAKIPHIYPTDTNQKFSIIAIPEDPDATVSISSGAQDAGGEILLNEGTSEYTITVSRTGAIPDKNTYKFTVDYEPDLSLKSITFSSSESGAEDWTHTVPVQDGQTITIPYDSFTIAAVPNDGGVTLNASVSGKGDLSSGMEADTWTLAYPETEDTYALYSTVKIKSTKNITNGGTYEKDFTLKFEKIVDADWPTSYWAEATGVSIIKDGDTYYEVHTFTKDGTLSFSTDDATTAYLADAKFDYLIVAGGGGAGADRAGNSDYSGGGGAGGLLYKTGAVLSLQDSGVAVIVGAGGTGGSDGEQGANGDPSAIGNIEVPGGGGGGSAYANPDGKDGGSGGGSGAGIDATAGNIGKRSDGIAAEIAGNNGGSGSTNSGKDSGGGGGGAAGAGQKGNGTTAGAGGAPWTAANAGASWVSAVTETAAFSRGGDGGSPNSANGGTPGAHYGDGGSGGNNSGGSGGTGHSGIVVIRFPAKPNPPAGD